MMLSERLRRWKENLSTRNFPEYVLTLRSDINRFADDIDRLADMVQSLESENEKLRELVDAWMGCGTRYHTMQGACPMFDKNAKDFCKAEEIARKLGIEVGP